MDNELKQPLKHQRTLELTSQEIMSPRGPKGEKAGFMNSTWVQHQTVVAMSRLEQEAETMRNDLRTKKDRLERVEAQIALLGTKGDQSELSKKSGGKNAWFRKQFMWLIAGVVTGVLKLSFCVVFGSLIHESAGELLTDSTSIGIGVQLVSAFVTCLITAMWSTVGISISGPDIIQALMLANMAKVIARKTNDKDVALATMLFLSAFTTILIALTWLLIVRYRLMVVLDFFPVSVVTGFLGCIGYKVVEEAVHIAVGKYWYEVNSLDFWKLLLPIIPLGLPLYLLKRFHIGSPVFVFPFFVVFPVALFFCIVFGSGFTLDDMRVQGWMFQSMEAGKFYEQWTKFNIGIVNINAVVACIPDMMILVLVITLDAFLKLSSTRTELSATWMDIEKELQIGGIQSLVSAACVGTVGYSQIKFNVLNFAIVNDMNERRPCLFVAVLCGVVWFGGIPLTNWLPRFFLAGLLLYAGLPFLDMVVSAYWRVTKKEFFAILIIVLTNAVTEIYVTWSLLIAVIVGLLLATVIFMVQYSRVSVIRDVISGKDYSSTVVRSYSEQTLVERLGIRYIILELQGFLFFGTGRQVLDWCKRKDKKNKTLESYKRLRYIAIDFTHVENMDYSCAKTFMDIADNIKGMGCQMLFVGMNEKTSSKLEDGVLDRAGVMVFTDLDYASEYVEDSLLDRASFVRLHWLLFDSFRKLHTRALLMARYEIFVALLGSEIGRRIWRYAEQREFKAGDYLCREGHINHTLFLLQRGKVTSITKNADGTTTRLHTMRRGAFFNEECLFLDRPVSYSSYANEDSVVWAIDRKNMKDLEAHDPFLAAEIMRNILMVSSTTRMRLEREVCALETSTLKGGNSSTKGLGHTILEQITTRSPSKKERMEDSPAKPSEDFIDDPFNSRRSHHFQHISVKVQNSKSTSPHAGADAAIQENKSNLLDTCAHLSRPMLQDVRDCFLFHSASVAQHKLGNSGFGKAQFFSQSRDVSSKLTDSPISSKISAILAQAGERRIEIRDLQKAVMDLGMFPTQEEIEMMHQTLGPASMERISGDEHEHGADIKEFISMIEVLSFAELTQEQRQLLLDLFNKYADVDNHLWKEGLSSLMRELGHPEDELELEQLMHEWDVHQRGYLDFSAFISIVAHVIKAEELDAKVEHDFLTLCGKEVGEIENNRKNLLRSMNSHIKANDIIRVGRERGMPINPEIAEEMIFDASESGEKKVSLNELIATIETVYRNESLPSKKTGFATINDLIPMTPRRKNSFILSD